MVEQFLDDSKNLSPIFEMRGKKIDVYNYIHNWNVCWNFGGSLHRRGKLRVRLVLVVDGQLALNHLFEL